MISVNYNFFRVTQLVNFASNSDVNFEIVEASNCDLKLPSLFDIRTPSGATETSIEDEDDNS